MARTKRLHIALFGPDKKHNAKPKAGLKEYRYIAYWWEGKQRRERWLNARFGQPYAAELAALEGNFEQITTDKKDEPRTVENALCFYVQNRASHVVNRRALEDGCQRIADWFGQLSIEDITEAICGQYVDHVGSIGTARLDLSRLGSAIRYCNEHRKNWPARKIWRPEKPKSGGRLVSEEEFKKVLADFLARGLYHHALTLAILMFTGQRIEVVVRLRWDLSPLGGIVDLENGIINFNPDTRAATKKVKPTIPIPAQLQQALEDAYAERITDCPWVCGTGGDADAPASSFRASLKTACRRAGVEYFNPHRLRHTRITRLVNHNVQPSKITRAVGVSQQTINSTYLHLQTEDLRDVVDKPL